MIPEAMIFDMDGTLFQTETLTVPAYFACFEQLKREGLYRGETPPVERFLGGLGLLLEEIWRRVLPDEPVAVHERANELLLQIQLDMLQKGVGQLYPVVAETLAELHRRGIRLFVASNGLQEYIEGVVAGKGLSPYFEGLYSAGKYSTRSKVELVRLLLDRHRLQSAWMVGDRSSDVEAGKRNGLLVVGCNYAGFGQAGELDGADRLIESFGELLSLMKD